MAEFEHAPYCGTNFERGGLMIWGFSHHKPRDAEDGADFTSRIVEDLALREQHWFFRRIASYFGSGDCAAFWQSVAFANTLPTCVPSETRFSAGTQKQRRSVPERVKRILIELQPSKVVLFSTKGWLLWPELNGAIPEPGRTLMSKPDLKHGTYDLSIGFEIKAYNLPHPQGQSTRSMTDRVDAILADELRCR